MTPKTYTIQLWQDGSGQTRLTRVNKGFTPVELRGVLELVREDLITQRIIRYPLPVYHGHIQSIGRVEHVMESPPVVQVPSTPKADHKEKI